MARKCFFTGKRTIAGRSITRRGKAKYLGGVGTKITGITRRQFKPNLQRVRITTAARQAKTVLVCTKCLKSGAVVKRIKAAPFQLPREAKAAAK